MAEAFNMGTVVFRSRSPLNFVITHKDDLLVWADLWLDYNEPLYADACRWCHRFKRWPRKSYLDFRWDTHASKSASVKKSLVPVDTCNLSSTWTSRAYPTRTLAFLDLFNHMVSKPAAFLADLRV
jgi:hypothetical protein